MLSFAQKTLKIVEAIFQKRPIFFTFLVGIIGAFVSLPLSYYLGTHPFWQMPYTDPQNSLIGIRYFVNEPWKYPFLFVTGLLSPIGVNVAFLDPLPFFMILNKLLAPLLPADTHLLGFSMLICIVLQPVATCYALRAFGRFPWYAYVLIGAISLLIPAWLLQASTVSLCGHYLFLFGFGLYVRMVQDTPRQDLGWLFLPLLILSLLIHVYIFAMVAGFWAATNLHLFSRYSKNIKFLAPLMWQAAAIVAAVTMIYVTFGYGGGYTGGQYGYFSMNLLSPFLPQVSDITGMTEIYDPTGGQSVGYNWLGIGLWFIILATLIGARKNFLQLWRQYWPLIVLSCGLTLVALSTKIYLGPWLILDADFLNNSILDSFRASGRFFWPVTYILLIFSFVALWQKFEKSTILPAIVLIAAILQFLDTRHLQDREATFIKPRPEVGDLEKKLRPLIEQHKRVFVYPPFHCAYQYSDAIWKVQDITFLASFKALPINSVFLARRAPQHEINCVEVKEKMFLTQPSAEDIIVYLRKIIPDTAIQRNIKEANNQCIQNADYVICTPRVRSNQSYQLPEGMSRFNDTENPYDLSKPTKLVYKASSPDNRTLAHGWNEAEANGVWSQGSNSQIVLPLSESVKSSLRVKTSFAAFIRPANPQMEIKFSVNGTELSAIKLDLKQVSIEDFSFSVPKTLLKDREKLVIDIDYSRAVSPQEIGEGADTRKLGINLQKMQLTPQK